MEADGRLVERREWHQSSMVYTARRMLADTMGDHELMVVGRGKGGGSGKGRPSLGPTVIEADGSLGLLVLELSACELASLAGLDFQGMAPGQGQ